MPATAYPTELWFDIATLVSTAQPDSIGLLGDIPTDLLDDYQAQLKVLGKHCSIQQLDDAQAVLNDQQQYDLVIVANLLEYQGKTLSSQIISRLRDVLSQHLCVALTLDDAAGQSVWQRNELFALGLKRVAEYQIETGKIGLFKHHLRNYKNTPDWLNADNWANPEMWGKYWW